MEEMPQICLGTVLQSNNREYLKRKFKEAIDHGYHHIDSAQAYNNMSIMPEVIQYGITKYKRDGFWITWKYIGNINETKIRVDINILGCGYLDLVLLHFPSKSINLNKEYMDILIKLKKEDLIKNIGVSNYENPHDLIILNDYLKTKDCCIYANQIQARPIGASANVIKGKPNPDYNLLLDVCKEQNIRLMLFSPYSALMKRMFHNNVNNEDAEIINEILSNPDFGEKVISYYTRKYLLGTRNVLINGIANGTSCIRNYDTIESILDKPNTSHNANNANNTNKANNAIIFKKINKLKLANMSVP